MLSRQSALGNNRSRAARRLPAITTRSGRVTKHVVAIQSVADAARKARAQKKDSVKPAKVFTDDNVGDIKGQISIVGAEPAAREPTTHRQRRTTQSRQMRPRGNRMRPTGKENLPQRANSWPTTREN